MTRFVALVLIAAGRLHAQIDVVPDLAAVKPTDYLVRIKITGPEAATGHC